MLPRVLEPEAMDTPQEARDYDAMDHAVVNARFVAEFLEFHGACRGGEIVDVGTGPAQIPIALCLADRKARVVAVDLAEAMLAVARQNIRGAGLEGRIRLLMADAKAIPSAEGAYEAVVSNSIVHHVPDPAPALAEMFRLIEPGGTLFVRDLARPSSLAEIAHLVRTYAGSEPPAARAMFEASLHAALSLEEVKALIREFGLPTAGATMTSDRHWTWAWRRPLVSENAARSTPLS